MTDLAALFPYLRRAARPDLRLTGQASNVGGPLGVLLFAVLALVGLAFAIVGTITKTEALSLSGAFGVLFFGVGGAPLQLVDHLNIYARLTCATLIGFSLNLAVGALMADVRPLWHPVPAAIVIGCVAVALHVRGLLRVRRDIAREFGPALRQSVVQASMASPVARASLLLTAIGTAFWLGPAVSTYDRRPGVLGFLTIISPIWYAGLALVVVGFAIGRSGGCTALVSSLSFGLAGALTPALVYAVPRIETAAKQMLLTQSVLKHHHIDPQAGIYQAFSGLFSGMAWLCQLIDVHSMLGSYSLLGLATFWPVIIVFLRVFELRLLAGRVLQSPGRSWGAVMLVLLVDTINDANYFSPQNTGYVLAFGVLAIALTGVTPTPLKPPATFALLLLAGIALALTHELSPYLTAGAFVILAVTGQAPWWSSLAIGVPALGWAAVVRSVIGSNFSFAQLFDLANLVPPKTPAVINLARDPAIGNQAHALLLSLLILIGLAVVGFLANIRTIRAWGYAFCPIVGLGLTLINPYGNEGIFRASLFAIPWWAILAMQMPHPKRTVDAMRRAVLLTAASSVILLTLLATFVVAEWGIDGTSVMHRSDVAVLEYLGSRPARHAFVVSLGASGDDSAFYPRFLVNYTTLSWDTAATRGLRALMHPGGNDLVALTDSYGAAAALNGASTASPLYIFWSGATLVNSVAYGVQSASQMNGWLKLLKASPVWRMADHTGDTYLFELRR